MSTQLAHDTKATAAVLSHNLAVMWGRTGGDGVQEHAGCQQGAAVVRVVHADLDKAQGRHSSRLGVIKQPQETKSKTGRRKPPSAVQRSPLRRVTKVDVTTDICSWQSHTTRGGQPLRRASRSSRTRARPKMTKVMTRI